MVSACEASAAPFEDMMNLLEDRGMSGFWSWHLERDDHFWSRGCFDLLGLKEGEVSPGYGRLMRLVHPEDRHRLPRIGDFVHGAPVPPQTVQLVRDDGTTRMVLMLFGIRSASARRPSSVCGLVLDVTDREWLVRSRADAIGRRRALDAHAGLLRFTVGPGQAFDFVPDAARLLNRSLSDINADPFATLKAAERSAVHDLVSRHRAAGTNLRHELTIARPGEPDVRALLVMVPARFDRSEADVWDGLLQIESWQGDALADVVVDPVCRVSKGCDFVAARAILGWSRHRLAEAANLSLSTVRRVEDDQEVASDRSRAKMVGALRSAGVRIQVTMEGTIAISRRSARPANGR